MLLKSSIYGGIINLSIIEFFKIVLLKITNNPQKAMIISSSVGYIIAYVIQRKVFSGGNFFGISFIKWFSVAAIGLQASQIVLHWLINQQYVTDIINNHKYSDNRKKIMKYLIINFAILLVFLLFDFPLRKSFIFVNKPCDKQHSIILLIAGIMYIHFNHIYLTSIDVQEHEVQHNLLNKKLNQEQDNLLNKKLNQEQHIQPIISNNQQLIKNIIIQKTR